MVATNFSDKSLQNLSGAQGELGLDKESLLQNLWPMSIILFVRSTGTPGSGEGCAGLAVA